MFTGEPSIQSSQAAHFLESSQAVHFPKATDFDRAAKIKKSIGSTWYHIPVEEKLDQAFDSAKEIESFDVRHSMLCGICNAYLKLSTLESCKKAYQVAQYQEREIGDARNLLNVIVGVCLQLHKPETLCLAGEIFESYPEQMAFSEHRDEFYSAQADLKKIFSENEYEQKTLTNNELRKRVENYLIKERESNAILGRDAKELIEKREFRQGIQMANRISDDISRGGVFKEIFARCCVYGDTEALDVAFDTIKNKTTCRDIYILSLIDTCQQLKNKGSALKFADEIQNPMLREEGFRKING